MFRSSTATYITKKNAKDLPVFVWLKYGKEPRLVRISRYYTHGYRGEPNPDGCSGYIMRDFETGKQFRFLTVSDYLNKVSYKNLVRVTFSERW
jgi:hypothetical protein